MNEEHDGKPSEEEYQRFRKMMDGMGREGILRMVEHLTERIEANPRDTEALGARGLAYSELGEHRLAAEDYGGLPSPWTPAMRAPTSTGPAPTLGWRSTA